MPLFYHAVRILIILVSRGFFRTTVLHKNRLPKRSGYIIAMNHSAYVDHLHIMAHEKRVVRFLANEKLFESPFKKWFFTNLKQIKVDRKKGKNSEAIEYAVKVLREGGIIGIYPEGTAKDVGVKGLLPGRTGVARLALLSKAPLVPAGIAGNIDVYGREKRFPRLRKQVLVVGRPMDLKRYYGKEEDKEVLVEITGKVMERIAGLIEEGEGYR